MKCAINSGGFKYTSHYLKALQKDAEAVKFRKNPDELLYKYG